VADLETALEHANAANMESQKTIKKLQLNLREVQVTEKYFLLPNLLKKERKKERKRERGQADEAVRFKTINLQITPKLFSY
jgi:hypothetical protein